MSTQRIALLVLLATTGCGRIGYQSALASADAGDPTDADPTDAGPPDAGPPDAGPGPFGPPMELPALSAAGVTDDDPSLTADLLEIYFRSDRDGGDADIWRATRATLGAPWSPATKVVELSTDQSDVTPEVSPDGLEIYLSSDRPGSAMFDIWRATRASRAEPWGAPVRVAELSSDAHDFAAAIDGSRLHVVLTRQVGTDLDLFRASRPDAAAPWGAPQPIAELARPGWDADAAQDASGTLLFFTSDRPGGAGARDIWRAERSAPEEPYGPPVQVAEVASEVDDEDPWLSPDGRTLYFVRNVGGDPQLYVVTR